MKKLIGFSLLAALLSAGCSDEDMWGDLGTPGRVVFTLQHGDVSAVADIDLYRPGDDVPFHRLSAAEGDAALEAALAPGSYVPVLVDFTLYYQGEPVPTSEVDFIGFNPAQFAIVSGATTHVTLSFERGTSDVIDLEPGGGGELIVERQSPCDPACGAGQVCADVNDAGPACYDTCTDEDEDACGDEARCFIPADAESGICLPNPS